MDLGRRSGQREAALQELHDRHVSELWRFQPGVMGRIGGGFTRLKSSPRGSDSASARAPYCDTQLLDESQFRRAPRCL
jgi:hypothetical protein